jgi:hypothetical protein
VIHFGAIIVKFRFEWQRQVPGPWRGVHNDREACSTIKAKSEHEMGLRRSTRDRTEKNKRKSSIIISDKFVWSHYRR